MSSGGPRSTSNTSGLAPPAGTSLPRQKGSRPRLALMPSGDEKRGKNRLHLDLRPDNQEAEVQRLEQLGAVRVDIGQQDVSWVVMADPEGNEFCVLRSRPLPADPRVDVTPGDDVAGQSLAGGTLR